MAHWVKLPDSDFPRDAIVGGHAPDGRPFVVGRVWIDGNPTPGMIDLRMYFCFATHRKAEVASQEFDVLRMEPGYDCTWVRASECKDYSSALRAGTPAKGEKFLYIGRGSYEGRTVIGKVAASAGVLSAAHEGREVLVSEYEVLCLA
jgi:hypothetical protein